MNKLGQKANQFKPKLDAMQQQILNKKLEMQKKENGNFLQFQVLDTKVLHQFKMEQHILRKFKFVSLN